MNREKRSLPWSKITLIIANIMMAISTFFLFLVALPAGFLGLAAIVVYNIGVKKLSADTKDYQRIALEKLSTTDEEVSRKRDNVNYDAQSESSDSIQRDGAISKQSPVSSFYGAAEKVEPVTSAQNNGDVFIVVDVETPNTNNDRLSSVSMTKMEGTIIGDTITSLINPEESFDSINVELTGISEKDVRDAPTLPAYWPTIQKMLTEGTFVAHNAHFDLSVLQKACQAYGIQFPEVRYIDTLPLVNELLPDMNSYKLDAVCQYLSIPLNHHRSDSDSLACAKILQWAIDVRGIDPSKHIQYYSAENHATQTRKNRRKAYIVNPSETTRCVNELLSILKGIIDDDKVTMEEVYLVRNWLDDHQELAGNYPFDQIYEKIIDTIKNGEGENTDCTDVLTLCQTLIDPIKYAKCPESIDLKNKTVCISGDFKMGESEAVERWLSDQGAIVKERVVKNLDYLIVGDLGSPAWSSGNYGNKIKKAAELQFRGAPVQIVRECDLMKLVGAEAK